MRAPPDEPLDEIEDDTLDDPAGTLFDILVEDEDEGQRLDRVLTRHLPDLSRSRLQTLIAAGAVARLDRGPNAGGTIGSGAIRVKSGERFEVNVPPPEPAAPTPQPIPLAIVHEDAELIVIDKPAGLVVHPAPGNPDGTLVNALLLHCGADLSGIGGVRRPGIVHRLDKETSGLMVVAKTDAAHRSLAAQFADHGRSGPLERAYTAFVWGMTEPRGTVDAPLGRHPTAREKVAVRPGGRVAVTHWTRLETFDESAGRAVASRVECRLETGRTHQIRVHMAHIGHPLLGDAVYGTGFRTKAARLAPPAAAALEALGRQALHASRLGFEHPANGRTMRFESPLPVELARLDAALKGL